MITCWYNTNHCHVLRSVFSLPFSTVIVLETKFRLVFLCWRFVRDTKLFLSSSTCRMTLVTVYLYVLCFVGGSKDILFLGFPPDFFFL